MISEEKKSQYWSHFTDEARRGFRPKKITDIRLKQIKKNVFSDDSLWQRIVMRYGALDKTLDELKETSLPDYEHARSNFWALIREKIQRQLTKAARSPKNQSKKQLFGKS